MSKTFQQFYQELLTINDLYNLLQTSNETKDRIQESCIKLFVALGLTDDKNIFSIGNFSKGELIPLENMRELFKKSIISGGDKSDITTFNEKTKIINVYTSKNFSHNKKNLNIGDFKYTEIFTDYDTYFSNYKMNIITITEDKQEYKTMIERIHNSSSSILKKINTI